MSTKGNETQGNAPAFAATAYDMLGGGYHQEGLTKREYFAAMAMQGLLASQSEGFGWAEEVAIRAVLVADDLITSLNNNEGDKIKEYDTGK